MFGEIKTRTLRRRIVKRRNVRKNIKKEELPPLSALKEEGQPMCLAWHTKGICKPD